MISFKKYFHDESLLMEGLIKSESLKDTFVGINYFLNTYNLHFDIGLTTNNLIEIHIFSPSKELMIELMRKINFYGYFISIYRKTERNLQ